MSSLRSKPSFTPVTMLATRARVRPWSARSRRSSFSREIVSTLASTDALSPAGTGCESLPLGPSALTVPLLTLILTPLGMGMGFLPIRDMVWPLPHVGEDLAAHLLLAGVAIRHHAAGRGHHGHAHPGEDVGNLVVRDVHPTPRRGDAHQAGDDLLVAVPVLQVHAQDVLLAVVQD